MPLLVVSPGQPRWWGAVARGRAAAPACNPRPGRGRQHYDALLGGWARGGCFALECPPSPPQLVSEGPAVNIHGKRPVPGGSGGQAATPGPLLTGTKGAPAPGVAGAGGGGGGVGCHASRPPGGAAAYPPRRARSGSRYFCISLHTERPHGASAAPPPGSRGRAGGARAVRRLPPEAHRGRCREPCSAGGPAEGCARPGPVRRVPRRSRPHCGTRCYRAAPAGPGRPGPRLPCRHGDGRRAVPAPVAVVTASVTAPGRHGQATSTGLPSPPTTLRSGPAAA